jgi:hypothetical protein
MFAAIEGQGGVRDGDVVLMHDGLGPGARRGSCEATLELTWLLLAEAKRLGLTPSPVSECGRVLA